MKKIVIIPPRINKIECGNIHNLYEKYRYISRNFCIAKKEKENTIDIHRVITKGVHSNFIKFVVGPDHFDIAKKISDEFSVNINLNTFLILYQENKKLQIEKIINFLDKESYSLCFLVGFEREIYLNFSRDKFEFYFESLNSA